MATIVDSYSEANQSDVGTLQRVHPTSDAADSAIGQSFTGDGQKISSCKFYLKRVGSPGNMIARLYAHTGTFGAGGKPTGSALDSSNIVAASGVSNEALELVEFTGFNGYTLADGTHYCIVVEGYDGLWSSGSKISVGRDVSSPTHGGNYIYFRSLGWVALTADTCFYVYGVPAIVAPTVTAQAATNKEDTTATTNGNITDNGGENCDKRGVVYDTETHADPGDVAPGASGYANFAEDTDGFGTGAFTKAISSLPPGTTIYYRMYAHNSAGYDYSNTEITFLTKPAAPTNVAATDGDHTNKVVVTWTKSTGATGYKVYEGANLLDTLGDVATYDDNVAPAPTITPGAAAASDGISSVHVVLSLAGEGTSVGASRTYKVVALNATGDSDDSDTDTGYRGVGALTYKWQRSAADSDASFGNITGGTTDPYNDTGAPGNGQGRWYRCLLNATGAVEAESTHDRGYRWMGDKTAHMAAKMEDGKFL